MSQSTTVSARDILQTIAPARQQIWGIQGKRFNVVFEDGHVSEMNKQAVILSRYCWELLHVVPATLSRACDIRTYIPSTGFNGEVHIQFLDGIFKHICRENHLKTYNQKAPLLKMVYEIVDFIQNEILLGVCPWMTTISGKDLIGTVTHPDIVKIHENLRPTPEGMDQAYRDIKTYVVNTKDANRFVAAYRSKAANDNQSNQTIGPRGFVTDLSRTVYSTPIKNGFIRGMGTLYELIAESNTAAKSLNANGTQIATSQYTSRRFQVLAAVVDKIWQGDCGSQEYTAAEVTPSNIDNLRGKYFLNEETNQLQCIEGDESYLYNKLIKLRSSLHCKHPDDSRICTTCLGELSQNFEPSSNLGYTFSAYVMEKISQGILGTKHITQSVRKSAIMLELAAQNYFRPDENGFLYFKKGLNLKGLQLVLPNASVGRLVDALNMQHTNIGLAKIGELDSVTIRDMKPKTPTQEKLNISYKDRNCILTQALLMHIKTCTMESDHRGNFVIPLDDFNPKEPVFSNPLKEANVLTLVNSITSIVETNKAKITDPDQKLGMLMQVVADRFKCNMSVLEVLIYATTTYNASAGNYRLGRNSPTPSCAGKLELFRHRDFGGLAIYEKQLEAIFKHPEVTFSRRLDRQEHPMNVFITPQAAFMN
ncbi:MAG: hypothetical protein PHN51_10210 [Candidatus Nanopelagicales bacterium]|nr:hypothetical protein [Candidatus Nanopelagicales bacterium]